MSTIRHLIAKVTADTSGLEQGVTRARKSVATLDQTSPFKSMTKDVRSLRRDMGGLATVISAQLGGTISRIGTALSSAFSFGPLGLAAAGVIGILGGIKKAYDEHVQSIKRVIDEREKMIRGLEREYQHLQKIRSFELEEARAGGDPAKLAAVEILRLEELVARSREAFEQQKQALEKSAGWFTLDPAAVKGLAEAELAYETYLRRLEKAQEKQHQRLLAEEKERPAMLEKQRLLKEAAEARQRGEEDARRWNEEHVKDLLAISARIKELENDYRRLGETREQTALRELEEMGATQEQLSAAAKWIDAADARKRELEEEQNWLRDQEAQFAAYWADIDARAKRASEAAKTPFQRLKEEVTGLNQLYELGKISAEEYLANLELAEKAVGAGREAPVAHGMELTTSRMALAGLVAGPPRVLDDQLAELRKTNAVLQRILNEGGLV